MNRNIAMVVQYDGTAFHGFQRQAEARSVQEDLESAISSVAAQEVQVVCAGRTDTGVHATRQVVNFPTPVERSLSAWHRGTNALLPSDVAVTHVTEVAENFSARYSALWRRYFYVFGFQDHPPVFGRTHANWLSGRLDVEAMQCAANGLRGERDFASFQAAGCDSKSSKRFVYRVDIVDLCNFVVLDIIANAFLLRMVRNIAGYLLSVARGKVAAGEVANLLAKRDRTFAPPTASAAGLYLVDVGYEDVGLNLPMVVPPILGQTVAPRFRHFPTAGIEPTRFVSESR